MAVGNVEGKVMIFDLTKAPAESAIVLSHAACRSTIRQLAFSHDSTTLVYVCDDGTLWRWDKSG